MARSIAVIIRDGKLRAQVSASLRQAGATVREGDLATQAWNYGRDPDIDLLIVDLHLSDAHGDDVLKDLRDLPDARPLPALVLIEDDDAWFHERAEACGAEAVLAYDRIGELVPTVGRLLRADSRVDVRGFADYYIVQSSERHLWSAETVDVSMSGIALDAKVCELEKDFLVDVRLRLPELAPVMARAAVVRVHHSSSGWQIVLAWEGFRQGDRERLAAWIRMRARAS